MIYAFLSGHASAQDFPVKPVRFLVSFPPGGGYTLLVTGDVPITQSHLLGKVSYDPAKDL